MNPMVLLVVKRISFLVIERKLSGFKSGLLHLLTVTSDELPSQSLSFLSFKVGIIIVTTYGEE